MDTYSREKRYLDNTTDKICLDFVLNFSNSSENQLFLESNKENVYLVSSKLLGLKTPEFSSAAIDFYRAVGLENVSEHLVLDCLGSSKSWKTNLTKMLITEDLNTSNSIIESLIYGLNSPKSAEKSKEILDFYRIRDLI